MQLAIFVTETLQAKTSTAPMLLKAHGTKLLQRHKGEMIDGVMPLT